MRLFIRSDREGNIVSTMKVNVMAEGLEHPYGDIEEGEMVVEVEPTTELERLACHEICELYTFDTEKEKLKKKD